MKELSMVRLDTITVLRTTRFVDGEIRVTFSQGTVEEEVSPDVISIAPMNQEVIRLWDGHHHYTHYLEPMPISGMATFFGHQVVLGDETNDFLEDHGAPSSRFVAHPSGVISCCGNAKIVEAPENRSARRSRKSRLSTRRN